MNGCDALQFRKTKTENDRILYRQQRNRVNCLIREAKNVPHKILLRESASNLQEFWNAIKPVFPTKEKSTCPKSFNIYGESYSESCGFKILYLHHKHCFKPKESGNNLKRTSSGLLYTWPRAKYIQFFVSKLYVQLKNQQDQINYLLDFSRTVPFILQKLFHIW